jgi:hypothetical protein
MTWVKGRKHLAIVAQGPAGQCRPKGPVPPWGLSAAAGWRLCWKEHVMVAHKGEVQGINQVGSARVRSLQEARRPSVLGGFCS